MEYPGQPGLEGGVEIIILNSKCTYMIITTKQRFLLIAPAIVVPFLAMIFIALGGEAVKAKFSANSFGLNTELPGVVATRKAALPNKMASYQRADLDSARKREI